MYERGALNSSSKKLEEVSHVKYLYILKGYIPIRHLKILSHCEIGTPKCPNDLYLQRQISEK